MNEIPFTNFLIFFIFFKFFTQKFTELFDELEFVTDMPHDHTDVVLVPVGVP